MDNSASDTSSFDIELLKEDFSIDELADFGISVFEPSEIDVDKFFEDSEQKVKEPKTIKCPKCGEIIEL